MDRRAPELRPLRTALPRVVTANRVPSHRGLQRPSGPHDQQTAVVARSPRRPGRPPPEQVVAYVHVEHPTIAARRGRQPGRCRCCHRTPQPNGRVHCRALRPSGCRALRRFGRQLGRVVSREHRPAVHAHCPPPSVEKPHQVVAIAEPPAAVQPNTPAGKHRIRGSAPPVALDQKLALRNPGRSHRTSDAGPVELEG